MQLSNRSQHTSKRDSNCVKLNRCAQRRSSWSRCGHPLVMTVFASASTAHIDPVPVAGAESATIRVKHAISAHVILPEDAEGTTHSLRRGFEQARGLHDDSCTSARGAAKGKECHHADQFNTPVASGCLEAGTKHGSGTTQHHRSHHGTQNVARDRTNRSTIVGDSCQHTSG